MEGGTILGRSFAEPVSWILQLGGPNPHLDFGLLVGFLLASIFACGVARLWMVLLGIVVRTPVLARGERS